jgi:APA family basic amino acid/polyamine antiporter
MALTFASYADPGPWWAQRAAVIAAVAGLSALNYRGVTKPTALTRALVARADPRYAAAASASAVSRAAVAGGSGGWP